MNNPLAQKYNYYLNESHRLNEELQLQTEYRELLENILINTLNEEQICELRNMLKKLGVAAVAGSCLLGTGGCGKHEAPKPAPVHAGVEGQEDLLIKKPSPAAKPAAKKSAKIPGAGAEGQL